MKIQLSSLKIDSRFINLISKQKRCGSARHFNSKCYHDTNPFQYLGVELVEQVHSNNLENMEQRKIMAAPVIYHS